MATDYYFNIYTETGTLMNTGGPLLVTPAPTTPSGGYDYSGLTPADLLSFDTGNLATMSGLNLAAGVYKVGSHRLAAHAAGHICLEKAMRNLSS